MECDLRRNPDVFDPSRANKDCNFFSPTAQPRKPTTTLCPKIEVTVGTSRGSLLGVLRLGYHYATVQSTYLPHPGHSLSVKLASDSDAHSPTKKKQPTQQRPTAAGEVADANPDPRAQASHDKPDRICEPGHTGTAGLDWSALSTEQPGMMLADTPPSPSHHPNKRPRQSSPERESPASVPSGEAPSPANDLLHDGSGATHGGQGGGSAGGKAGQSSSFRNVSACNRCRLRKNRCDQKLPSCASCEKANVACVGYDPITKREIPRRSEIPPAGIRFPAITPDSAQRFASLSVDSRKY